MWFSEECSQSVKMAEYNPFAEEPQMADIDNTPDFRNSRIVLGDATDSSSPHVEGSMFDLTEYPTYFDNGLEIGNNETPMDDARPSTSSDDTPRRRSDEQAGETLVVQVQPRREDTRAPLPVYTMGWSSLPHGQFLPLTGLDFLTGVPEVSVQQTVEDLVNPSSCNRYIIKVPNGETLYVASENSTALARTFLGAQRGFNMALLDPTRQEAARFNRRTGCTMNFLGCFLQELEVHTSSPNLFVGKIKQDWTLSTISFSIVDEHFNVVFKVEGPSDACPCGLKSNTSFAILNNTGSARLGVISRYWDNHLGDFNLRVVFPAPGIPEKQKLLFIGATMLIEYMYFAGKRIPCFCC